MGDAKKQKTADISGPASSQDPGESDGVNHWPLLSDEVVLYILRLLPQKDLVRSSLIDRRFRTLSRDDALWTELTLEYEEIKQNTESCRKLVDRCKKLASLKISKEIYMFEKLNIMTVVIRAKDTLQSLEVDHKMQYWSPAAMTKLGRLENLKCLSMAFNSEPYKVNSYAGAKMLEELAKLGQLEELKLSISHRHSCHPNANSLPVMKKVFQQLKKLKKVDIYTPHYDDSLVVALAENNPNLRVLRLKNYPSLRDETVDALAKSCPVLEEFAISFEGEGAMNKLASSFPNVKHLELGDGDAHGFTDEKLATLESFRRLESLDLIGFFLKVTNSGIERMVSSAENLKHLGIGWPPRGVTRDLVDRLRIENPNLDLRIGSY